MNVEADMAAPRDASKQRLRLWLQLLRATRRIEAAVREGLRERYNTTLPQFDVMAALYRSDAGLSMTQLSRALRVSNGNVTGIVDRLEEAGMLLRRPDERDRRAMHVTLTEHGRGAFAEMAEVHEGWIGRLLASFDDEETDRLLDLLNRFNTRGGGRER